MEIENRNESKIRKFRRYITVEPVMLAINVPYCLLVICLQNLILEKVSYQSEFGHYHQDFFIVLDWRHFFSCFK